MARRAVAGAVLLGTLSALPGAAAPCPWPEFRGPTGDGQAPNADPPVTWSATDNVAWRTALPGRGWSSPVVCDGVVWMTTALDDERSLRLLGVDAASGELRFDVEVFHPPAWQASDPQNTFASPTPAVEEGRVYVHFGTYGTAALSTVDARVLWRNDTFHVDHEVGPGSSPILYRDLVIVDFDGTDQQFVAAFDKLTGDVVWKTDRSLEGERKGPHRKAFSTPLVVEVEGRPQLVSPGAGQVDAYDPRTGLELWRVRYEGYSIVPRPVAGHGMVFVDTGYIKPHLYAIRLGGRGDVTASHVAWDYWWQVPANPSPLLIGDRLFMVSDWGIATWLDLEAGDDLWRQRLGGQYFASPIYAAGRIYAVSMEGKTTVLEAGESYRPLAVNELGEKVMASPAAVGEALFLRSERHLFKLARGAAPARR